MRIRTAALAAIAAATVVTLAACTSPGQMAKPMSGDTIRTAFSFAMQQPDPDIFFQAEGLNVTMAAYEGLLRHTPNAEQPDIEPWLATSYDVSDDGMDYTFHLRENVTFQDGSPMDAAAVKFSFDRRLAINAGPVESMFAFKSAEVIDPQTVVIHLTQPSTEFIPFLASAYGQKIVSPTTIKAHEVNGDLGQEWLKTHSAGTGPYEITKFDSDGYGLTAYDGYWGDPAGYKNVSITIDPSFTSQELQLENNTLDVLTHGVPTADLARLKSEGFTVTTEPTFNRALFFLNPDTPAFATKEGRNAIGAAIDRDTIVKQVYGEYATVAQQMFPAGLLPSGQGEYTVKFDAAAATAYVSTLADADKTIDLAYVSDDSDNQQVAQIVQSELQAVGLDVTARAVSQPETFEYPTTPDKRPDILLVGGISADAAHPDPFARLFFAHDGGLSYFQPQQALDADALLDRGRNATTADESMSFYAQAADAYADSGLFIPFTDRPEVIITRPGITGVEHEFNAISTIRLASLKPAP